MGDINFSLLTIPTPEPYDAKDDRRQHENLCYVLNQLLVQAQNAGFVLSDQIINLSGIVQGIQDLQHEGVLLDLGCIKVIKTGKTGSVYNA